MRRRKFRNDFLLLGKTITHDHRWLCFIILLFVSKVSYGQEKQTDSLNINESLVPGTLPSPTVNLGDYFGNNLQLSRRQLAELKGTRVMVSIIINKDGSVHSASIVKGSENCEYCKERIIEIAKEVIWMPAKDKNGDPVKVRMTVPIKF